VGIGTALLTKEARVVPSAMYGHDHGEREFDAAAALLSTRPEVADALVHHRFGLDDAPEAFRVAGDRTTGAIKVLLEP
jgi:threonine dehydrogenase-like Zn-dependent dehydrogenase